MRSLIVDDNYISRSHIKELLYPYGDCDGAHNGNIALEMFVAAHSEGMPYNLITMDIEMPELDGKEVVRRIRQWEKENNISTAEEAKIIMVTVKKEMGEISKSYIEGCHGYCLKPVKSYTLKSTLKEIGLLIS